jgi:hypothetical protein
MKRLRSVGMDLLALSPVVILIDMFVYEQQSLLVKAINFWMN